MKALMTQNVTDKIIDAGLACAGARSWLYVSLGDIAQSANMDLASLRSAIDDKFDVIKLIHGRLDELMLSDVAQTASTTDMNQIKDRIFDIIMARFDAMNDHRAAYLSILEGIKQDPTTWARVACLGRETTRWVLSASGYDTSRPMRHKLAITLLSVVYLNSVRAWQNDDSADMSATMASLDKGLDKVITYIS